MDYRTFKKNLTQKFEFDHRNFVGREKRTLLGFVDSEGCTYEITMLCDLPVGDTGTHFAAMTILAGDANEFVHILEPGKYFDHVFWNDHEYGLFSIDCIVDYEDELDMDAYSKASKAERIEQMPFFENLLAKSLQELLEGTRDFTQEELFAEQGARSALRRGRRG